MSTADGLARRELFKRGAVAGGAFAGLWALPRVVGDAYGDPIPIPPGARSVEAGLAAFAAKWELAGPIVRLTRFGPYLSDKIFNCRVAGTPRAYTLRLGSTLVIWNFRLIPARDRAAGVARVMSRPANVTDP